MSSLLAAQTTAATVKRYCDNCKSSVEPKIQPTKQSNFTESVDSVTVSQPVSRVANYHGSDVAAVECPNCGTQLGHLTYWPSKVDQ